ncbi:hypothetical protein QBC35DRAFT_250787 [Podospora australis]|uniref:Uncharacterized protein n=1 Tax=Podospora australis TaxID=1536484 RepID=A0AAN7AI93_9PEZI|nr:hypothetical protein QBC35DRAFT_250787 [Podospora australis]
MYYIVSSDVGSGGDCGTGSGTTATQGKPTTFADPPGGSGATPISQHGTQPTFVSHSVCHGQVCPSILSVAQFPSPPTAFLFGRGQDNAIWNRRTNGEKWLSEWESLGGDKLCQPAAACIDDDIVDLFVYARNSSIQTKQYYAGSWNGTWSESGKAITSLWYYRQLRHAVW